MNRSRALLIASTVLFLAWLIWLGYAALVKSHGPVVSRAEAAAATHPVVAAVSHDADGKPATKVKVVEALKPAAGPQPEAEIEVRNLPEASGFEGAGDYLLLLVRDPHSEGYFVVGPQRSPGYDFSGLSHPVIYPWSADVRAQAKSLYP